MVGRQVVGFGELLLRLDAPQHRRFVQARGFDAYYTGGEANTLVSLANFGVDSFIVSRVPDHEIGQACINYVRSFGVRTDYVLRGGNRLGILYVEQGASQRPANVIYDRAGSAFTELAPGDLDWRMILQEKDWLHFSGTAPALAEQMPVVVREACRIAKGMGVTVSCDLNYRSKLWSLSRAGAVMADLVQYVDVLLCNGEQAKAIFGLEHSGHAGRCPDAETYDPVARELVERFGMSYVAMTLRDSLSANVHRFSGMLYDGQRCYQGRTYEMQIVDRIGGGDAFGGGLIYGLLAGLEMQEVIEFATAASCLKHSIPGDFNLVSREEVQALVKGHGSGRIRR